MFAIVSRHLCKQSELAILNITTPTVQTGFAISTQLLLDKFCWKQLSSCGLKRWFTFVLIVTFPHFVMLSKWKSNMLVSRVLDATDQAKITYLDVLFQGRSEQNLWKTVIGSTSVMWIGLALPRLLQWGPLEVSRSRGQLPDLVCEENPRFDCASVSELARRLESWNSITHLIVVMVSCTILKYVANSRICCSWLAGLGLLMGWLGSKDLLIKKGFWHKSSQPAQHSLAGKPRLICVMCQRSKLHYSCQITKELSLQVSNWFVICHLGQAGALNILKNLIQICCWHQSPFQI